MPYEKLYYKDGKNPVDDAHLIIHITRNAGLYIEIGIGDNGCELQNIVLSNDDAIEIVKELAEDLGFDIIPAKGIVLDPFMGSGTTAVVARKLDRNFIGFELNPKYIKIAEKRLYEELGMFL